MTDGPLACVSLMVVPPAADRNTRPARRFERGARGALQCARLDAARSARSVAAPGRPAGQAGAAPGDAIMPVLFEKRDHVGIVTLSRPEARNAWGPDFNEGIARHFAAMEDDDDIRCAVLTGDDTGGAFSAGANLKNPKTHTQESPAAFIKGIAKRKDRPFEILGNFPKPLVGAVNGYAVGIGCIVTFCCDLLVASDRAEWRLPQVALGILPAYGGAVRLARWVGRGQAMRVALGIPLPADEAHRIGLAQWVVPHAKLMDKVFEVAGHVAALPPLA